jgi:lysine 2,3-aminomutase
MNDIGSEQEENSENHEEPPPSWADWKWQLKNRIRNINTLKKSFPNIPDPEGITAALQTFPMAITPYYASLIRNLSYTDPIFAMSIPNRAETMDQALLTDDPLGEIHDTVVPHLVHRYQDRALLIATGKCAMYCRHCTRKRLAGKDERPISNGDLEGAVDYIRKHPEIHDVVISGGDPLTLETEDIVRIVGAVRSVESVDIIRIGTRTPVTMPMRIDKKLCEALAQFHPLWINTHFNHPVEMTWEAMQACKMLADHGFPIGNQSVLLKGVNDSPQIMMELCRNLVKNRVRPYYLYQCDLVYGVEHFRTDLETGLGIMEALRGRLSGLAIPTFVIDAPDGGGKIPILPDYIKSLEGNVLKMRNFEGKDCEYAFPA